MDAHEGRRLIPIPDICAALGGISRTTVYNLIARGDLVRVNIGTRAFVTSDSLTAYLEKLSA